MFLLVLIFPFHAYRSKLSMTYISLCTLVQSRLTYKIRMCLHNSMLEQSLVHFFIICSTLNFTTIRTVSKQMS
jgi:hypothetical protein